MKTLTPPYTHPHKQTSRILRVFPILIAATLFCSCSDDSKKSEQDTCTQDKCEGWCGDFKSDPKHCGNCETACNPDEYCDVGTCQKLDSCTQDKCEGWCGDFMNDPKHCGNCETDCTQSGQTCVHGKCYSKLDLKPCKKADSDSPNDSVVACYKLKDEAKWVTAEEYAQNLDKYELESGDPNCISPYNEATCGAVNCSEYTECSDPYICMKGDDGFQCVCPNGMVEVPNADGNGKHCADPFAEDHCGITAENPAGSNCTPQENSLCNGEQCACKPGWVNCNGECIDPLTNDDYCGADAQCQNGKQCREGQQKCTDGVCKCTYENLINCDGICVDPNDDREHHHCGARGLCNSDDVNSPNYRGLDCGTANCSVTDSVPKCECDESEYYDESKKECGCKRCNSVDSDSTDHCGDDLVNCRAKYHYKAKCDDGLCHCPNHYARLDDENYKAKYEDKLNREGIAESSILCVDIQFDRRFCGEDLVTCKDDEMCFKGTCQPINKTECETQGRTLCENRCISFEDNHMITCDKCQDEWCSTELLVSTAGCNTKVGIGLNNCEKCLYDGNEQSGKKCIERYTLCKDNKCSCGNNELQFNVIGVDNNKHVLCVNVNEMKIEECNGCTYDFKCRNGWGDCIDGDNHTPSGVIDGKLGVDGCETNVHEGQIVDAHTINNCGACGQVCAPAHVDLANCSQGICSYRQCEDGYADCDGNPANGCESLLANDANNCGICGKACSEGGCQNSACCWNDAKYSTRPLTQDNCCEGTYLYKACDNNPFQKTRYTCASGTPTVDTDGWCVWSKVE